MLSKFLSRIFNLRSKWLVVGMIVAIIALILIIIYFKFNVIEPLQSKLDTSCQIIDTTKADLVKLSNSYQALSNNVATLQTQMAYGVIMDASPKGKLEIKMQHDTESQESSIVTQPIALMPVPNEDTINARVIASIDHDIEEIVGEPPNEIQTETTIQPSNNNAQINPITINLETDDESEIVMNETPSIPIHSMEHPHLGNETVPKPETKKEIINSQKNTVTAASINVTETNENTSDLSIEGRIESTVEEHAPNIETKSQVDKITQIGIKNQTKPNTKKLVISLRK